MDPDVQQTSYIPACVFIAVFMATVFTTRRTWMWTELLATGLFALVKFFTPRSILDGQAATPVDGFHVILTQSYASAIIGSDVVPLFLLWKGSSDRSVPKTVLVVRVLTTLILLLCKGYVHIVGEENQALNEQHLYFGFLGTLLWLLGNLIHLLGYARSTEQINSNLSNHQPEPEESGESLDTSLQIDFFVTLVLGVTQIAFPEVTLKLLFPDLKADVLHLHILRLYGTMNLGHALVSFSAVHFTDHGMREYALLGRILAFISFTSCLSWHCLVTGNLQTRHVLAGLPGLAFPGIVTVITYLWTRRSIKHAKEA